MQHNIDKLKFKTDYLIHKIVKNKDSYQVEIYEEAKRIYKMRDLDSREKQELISKFPEILNKCTNLFFQNRMNDVQLIKYLKNENVETDQAEHILKTLSEKLEAKNRKIRHRKVVFFVLSIIALFLKFILSNA